MSCENNPSISKQLCLKYQDFPEFPSASREQPWPKVLRRFQGKVGNLFKLFLRTKIMSQIIKCDECFSEHYRHIQLQTRLNQAAVNI